MIVYSRADICSEGFQRMTLNYGVASLVVSLQTYSHLTVGYRMKQGLSMTAQLALQVPPASATSRGWLNKAVEQVYIVEPTQGLW